MIKWQTNLAGFAGNAKTAIKGAFQYVFSTFTITPVDTPDCFVSLISTIDDDATGLVSTITGSIGLVSTLEDNSIGLVSTIGDSIGLISTLCD